MYIFKTVIRPKNHKHPHSRPSYNPMKKTEFDTKNSRIFPNKKTPPIAAYILQ